jgi:hypothetical protein
MAKHSKKRVKKVAGATPMMARKPALRPSLLAGATVGVATSVVGMAATQPESISASQVELAAVITEGSSTNWAGTEIKYLYNGQAAALGEGETVQLNFLSGPVGIGQALRDAPAGQKNVVISSGWGAANASAELSWLTLLDSLGNQAAHDTLGNTTWVLDNNVSRPNGGWGTRYPIFALIGVNPVPTPTDTNATVVDVGYQYNANSDAPAYPLNLVADANSLVAYLYGYQSQSSTGLPPEVDTIQDGQTIETNDYIVKKVGNTTYVTYKVDGLPLTRPLRDLGPAGVKVADVIEPALQGIVDYGYPNNEPLSDPSTYTPAGLVPGPAQTIEAAQNLSGAIQQGLGTLNNGSSDRQTAADPMPKVTPKVTTPKLLVKVSTKFTPKPTGGSTAIGTGPISTAVKGAVDVNKQLSKAVSDALKKPIANKDGARSTN